jgi:hypothetical protein
MSEQLAQIMEPPSTESFYSPMEYVPPAQDSMNSECKPHKSSTTIMSATSSSVATSDSLHNSDENSHSRSSSQESSSSEHSDQSQSSESDSSGEHSSLNVPSESTSDQSISTKKKRTSIFSFARRHTQHRSIAAVIDLIADQPIPKLIPASGLQQIHELSKVDGDPEFKTNKHKHDEMFKLWSHPSAADGLSSIASVSDSESAMKTPNKRPNSVLHSVNFEGFQPRKAVSSSKLPHYSASCPNQRAKQLLSP